MMMGSVFHCRHAAQLLQENQTLEPRQLHLENDQVRPVPLQFCQPCRHILGGGDIVPLEPQTIGGKVAPERSTVNNQNIRHRACIGYGANKDVSAIWFNRTSTATESWEN